MKARNRIFALLLVCMMVIGLSTTALAIDSGKGGPATITISNPEIGETYAFYQLFDATVSTDGTKIAYKLPAGKTIAAPATAWFDVSSDGYVTSKAALTAAVLQSDTFKTWAASFGTQQFQRTVTAADLTAGKLVVENLPYGYYFITTTLGTLVTIDSTTPNAEVIDKNNVPGWEEGKKIVLANGDKVDLKTVKIDEEMDFEITVNAKNYSGTKKIFRYEIDDIMPAGMTLTSDLTVKVGTQTISPTITYYTNVAMTTVTTDRAQARAFRVSIPWTENPNDATGTFIYATGSVISVTYSAKLDSEKIDGILFDASNVNKSVFRWFAGDENNPNPTDPEGISPDETTDNFVTELEVTKTDNTGKALEGAEFTLTGPTGTLVYTQGTRFVPDPAGAYWKLKDGTYTTTNPNTPNININAYESTTQRYKLETYSEMQGAGQTDTVMKGFVDANGKITFSGLVPGEYTLVESVVPSGYNKAADITFTVGFNEGTRLWTVTSPVRVEDDILKVTVVNNQGSELPSTGGIGTTIFYAAGSVLLLGAAVLLITRRRMKTEK